MKNQKVKIGIFSFLLVFSVSCNSDFLNTQPLDKISSEATWADGPLAEAFVYNVYSFLGYGGFEEQANVNKKLKERIPIAILICFIMMILLEC